MSLALAVTCDTHGTSRVSAVTRDTLPQARDACQSRRSHGPSSAQSMLMMMMMMMMMVMVMVIVMVMEMVTIMVIMMT